MDKLSSPGAPLLFVQPPATALAASPRNPVFKMAHFGIKAADLFVGANLGDGPNCGSHWWCSGKGKHAGGKLIGGVGHFVAEGAIVGEFD